MLHFKYLLFVFFLLFVTLIIFARLYLAFTSKIFWKIFVMIWMLKTFQVSPVFKIMDLIFVYCCVVIVSVVEIRLKQSVNLILVLVF